MTGPIQDVFCVAVPAALDGRTSDEVIEKFRPIAYTLTLKQYGGRPPRRLEFGSTDWLVTDDPADVESFQPAHDCAACLAGNDQAAAFLREHPGQRVAMANLTYTEHW